MEIIGISKVAYQLFSLNADLQEMPTEA